MAERRDEIGEAAILWLIRLRDGTAEDWERFAEWLEADPRHVEAYDEVALADSPLDALPRRALHPLTPPAQASGPARPARRAMLGWAAASAVLLSAGWLAFRTGANPYPVETAPGERRMVGLDGGTRIELNGATRLVLDRDDPRFARLTEGEAYFRIAHDPARPFRVAVGDARIRVLGTQFNVVRSTGSIELAVAEGAVQFEDGVERARVDAGRALHSENGRYALTRADPGAIGGWRYSRLSYPAATIGRIAADLSRMTGLRIAASPEVAGREFSGVIVVERDPDRMLPRVAALLAVEARRSGDGWLLTSGRAPR